MTVDIDRRCAMRARCRAFEVQDGKKVPARIEKASGLCEPCLRWVKRALSDLPKDWCKLKLSLGDHRSSVSDRVSLTPTPAAPINVDCDALMGAVVEVAAQAARATQVVTGIKRSGGFGRGYRSLVENARFAEARFADVLADQHGAVFRFKSWDESGTVRQRVDLTGFDIAHRLVDVHARVRGHLGESERLRREPLPCPRCDTPRALVREVQDRRGYVSASDGSATPEVVRCLACGEQWSETDYRWLSRLVSGEKEGKRMLDFARWLVAEARWERDVVWWLTAERQWALADIAVVVGVEGGAEAMLDHRRRARRVPA